MGLGEIEEMRVMIGEKMLVLNKAFPLKTL